MPKSRLLLLSLWFASCGAMADLYISPVVERGDIVTSAAPKAPVQGQAEPSSVTAPLKGIPMSTPALTVEVSYSSSSGGSSASKPPPARVDGEHYGNNIPLVVALEHLIPELERWRVHLEEGLERRVVSWSGGSNWQGAMAAIASQNDLSIIMNNAERAVGVSTVESSARALAKRVPDIWHAPAGKTVKEVLAGWTERAGWDLVWDDRLSDRCRVAGDLVFKQPFSESVDQLVTTACGSNSGIRKHFYLENTVLHITPSA